jgi:hypothetical protein
VIVWGILGVVLQEQFFLPQTLEGWFNLIGRIAVSAFAAWGLVVAMVKRMVAEERKQRIASCEKESEERKTADKNIDVRVHDLATDLHSLMGKFELMREDIHKAEKERIREMETLKREMHGGFSRIEGLLTGRQYSNRRDDQ